MAETASTKTSGTLYVVATPIGNLEDITLRALRVLKEADLIACEDTRHTLKLMAKYGIRNRLLSHFQPRERQRLPQIMGCLKAGQKVALVSDAGTPGLSDPGFRLIQEAILQGIPVVPIPGPSALTAALTVSGLPTHRFLFLGFPPVKKERAKKLLLSLAGEEGTLIFYLPTRKMAEFLEIVQAALGNRRVVIARELTKVFEEFIRGSADEVRHGLEIRSLKGEATLLIEGFKVQ